MRAQQSVHLTLGSLRKSQAVSHALAFFWLDGFAVPAPAQVPTGQAANHWAVEIEFTKTKGWKKCLNIIGQHRKNGMSL